MCSSQHQAGPIAQRAGAGKALRRAGVFVLVATTLTGWMGHWSHAESAADRPLQPTGDNFLSEAAVPRARLLPQILMAADPDADLDCVCASRVKPEHVPIIRQREEAGLYERPDGLVLGEVNVSVPLAIHVIRRTNGTGGLSAANINQTIADANDLWAQSGIQFCQYGPTRFIDSDFWFNTTIGFDLALTLLDVDVVPNTINVYFVPNFTFCGIGTFTFLEQQGIVMKNSCTAATGNTSTFAHELGHYFDLFHTHETAFGVECTSGVNCAGAGDLVCDTPADPNLFGQVNLACTYVGDDDPPTSAPCSASDPPYAPPTLNVMSYSYRPCRIGFTQQQFDRAVATLINLRPELINSLCELGQSCPGAGSCFESNGTPGCSIGLCCANICLQDPFCCNVNWDSLCANQASDLCLTGNECELAIPAGDGTAFAPGSSYTASGVTSSCSGADAKDVWFAYTAPCSGTVTASSCGEFTSGDVAISVFDACGSAEIACGDTHPQCGGGDTNAALNAQVSWPATKDTTYLVRVSATSEFDTAFFNPTQFQCSGCGHPDSGSCFTTTGTPFCNNVDCCQFICDFDPFCCNVNWDSICASNADTFCTSQCGGPITGSCYEPNPTPHCDRAACCNAICADDPFCCDVNWDSLCAGAAVQHAACEVHVLGGVNLIPLGNANLNLDPQGSVVVSNLGAAGTDGVRADFAASGMNLVGSSSFKLNLPTGLSRLEVVSMNDIVAPNMVVNTLGVALNSHQPTWDPDDFDLQITHLISPTYSLQVKQQKKEEEDPGVIFSGLTNPMAGTIFGSETSGPPSRITSYIEQENIYKAIHFDEPLMMFVAGELVEGDTIIIGTELHIIAILIGLEPLELGPLRDVDLLISAPGEVAAVESIEVETVAGCAGNCGVQSQVGCACDEACFDRGDCCSDVCEHCSNLDNCESCPGELTGDDEVNVDDLLTVLNNWGACPGGAPGCAGDANNDSEVNVDDLLIILNNWGPCP